MGWFILLLVVAGAGGFVWYRYSQQEQAGGGGAQRRSSRGARGKTAGAVHRAVELKPCDKPCELAYDISGKRFLVRDAPALPLPGCHRSRCKCRYEHFDDRRVGPRRDTSLYGVSVGKTREGGNRRASLGRRSSDRRRGSGA
ncbi:hypothetical protein FACS1894116_00680 [Betaproteobacteria bacterium]|nr:hypothetical protein FACS1894116_00680 [Betaproteobacteria bacterium]GHU28377.1 hypothetical protein FACS189497_03700 [Betaproteobacteria bacterium]